MGLTKDLGTLFRDWNDLESNLENEVLFYDFFRREEGYDPARPLILCKNHGLLALYRMEGLDPEPLGQEGIEMASNAVRRGMDAFNPENQEGDFRGGTWEVQNIFRRRKGAAPTLTVPSRDSAALRFLCETTQDYWNRRVVYQDEIIWAVHFVPRSRDQERWRLRDASQSALIHLADLQAQARFVRRVLKTFEENLLAFQTSRPRMGFGLRMLNEQEGLDVLYQLTNRTDADPPPYDPGLALLTQACASHRDTSDRVYRTNGRPTKILTWKVPPRISVGYVFRRFQDELSFPFTIAQTWRSCEFSKMSRRIELFQGFAGALASRQRDAAEYEAEAPALPRHGPHGQRRALQLVFQPAGGRRQLGRAGGPCRQGPVPDEADLRGGLPGGGTPAPGVRRPGLHPRKWQLLPEVQPGHLPERGGLRLPLPAGGG